MGDSCRWEIYTFKKGQTKSGREGGGLSFVFVLEGSYNSGRRFILQEDKETWRANWYYRKRLRGNLNRTVDINLNLKASRGTLNRSWLFKSFSDSSSFFWMGLDEIRTLFLVFTKPCKTNSFQGRDNLCN